MDKLIFEQANDRLGGSIAWEAMESRGHTNRFYQGRHHHHRYVLRINADHQRAFGVNRQREQEMLSRLQNHPWAPKIVACDVEAGWCLMGYAGENLPEGQLNGAIRLQLLSAAQQWLNTEYNRPYDYKMLRRRYERRFNQDTPKHAELRSLIDKVFLRLQQLPAVPSCLVHHDLHPGNIVVDKQGRLTVLDWEFARIGNPWFDIGALYYDFNCGLTEISRLSPLIDLMSEDIQAGLSGIKSVNQGLSDLWYRARRAGAGN